jgi:hypothetical protein
MSCSLDTVCKILVVMCILIVYILYKINKLDIRASEEGFLDGVKWNMGKINPLSEDLEVRNLKVTGDIIASNIDATGEMTCNKFRSTKGIWFGDDGDTSIVRRSQKDPKTQKDSMWLVVPNSNLHVQKSVHIDNTLTADMVRAGEGIWLGPDANKSDDERRIIANKHQNGGGIAIYGKLHHFDKTGNKISN